MNLSLEEECIHTLRFLSIDAVEKAHSGHPGLPLGAAPMAFVLWDKFLKHNPNNPQWFNHDRFILSAGHGCALLYSLLHCYGYPLSLDELKNFRQWGSLTPGHPEYHHTPGVEATTGPLGQGFGMGVGMAIAEQFLSATFNKPGFNIVDHYTYAIVSDGDLMEGVSSEAASLAGTLKCGKLIYLYDDNHISIEGDTALAFTEDVEKRFLSYHWHVIRLSDGNNLKAIEEAIKQAQNEKDKPSLIIIRTHIGFGSPKQDSAAAHGEPLGKDAVEQTRNRLRWHYGPFEIPETAQAHFTKALPKGHAYEAEWKTLFDRYKTEYVKEGYILETLIEGKLPIGWDTVLSPFQTQDGPMATRSASGKVMNQLAKTLPHLIGGSADLAPSTKTILNGFCDFGIERDDGRNLHFGVREHGMGAAVNGMALHGGIIPYGATFLIFSDYMRPSIRLSSLMKIHSIFVFTHDSIGLGEDGPTHQPIEHLMSLRAIPGFTVIRPADANETVWAWKAAIALKGPVALVLTRQNLPVLDPETLNTEGLFKGAYILSDSQKHPADIILIASGSEVHVILEARTQLQKEDISARVVSMPCWEFFDAQPESYKKTVLLPDIPKLAVEAGSPRGWRDYIGDTGDVIGLTRFGASAPGHIVYEQLGFHMDNVVERAKALLKKKENFSNRVPHILHDPDQNRGHNAAGIRNTKNQVDSPSLIRTFEKNIQE